MFDGLRVDDAHQLKHRKCNLRTLAVGNEALLPYVNVFVLISLKALETVEMVAVFIDIARSLFRDKFTIQVGTVSCRRHPKINVSISNKNNDKRAMVCAGASLT